MKKLLNINDTKGFVLRNICKKCLYQAVHCVLFYGENCFISQNIGPKVNFDLKLVRNS